MGCTTVFADASFCPETGAGGWGAWAKNDRGTQRWSGAFRDPTERPDLAEIKATLNAMAAVRRIAAGSGLVLVQCDCLSAIKFLSGPNSRFGDKRLRDLWKKREEIVGALTDEGVRVRFRHVKGHQGNKDRRSSVNEWCDRAAKRHMREQRAVLRRARKTAAKDRRAS